MLWDIWATFGRNEEDSNLLRFLISRDHQHNTVTMVYTSLSDFSQVCCYWWWRLDYAIVVVVIITAVFDHSHTLKAPTFLFYIQYLEREKLFTWGRKKI